MVFNRFASQLLVRVVGLLALVAALAVVLVAGDFVAVAALLGAAAIAQAWAVVRFVNRTNTELTRFLESIHYDDFTRSFAIGHLSESFADLEAAFEDVMERFRSVRTDREAQRRYLETLIEHVPVAIIAVHDGGAVSMLNNAARRLLDTAAETTVAGLDRYGAGFQQDISRAAAGDRTLTRAQIDGIERQLILSTTQITIGGGVRRLISLQDIQTELDATELSAWQDMVRVLSHEIGNSITPIASLARTADDIVVDLRQRIDDRGEIADLISDIHDAIDTITRRSEGLMRFVKSYRELTRLPPPKKRQISLRSYFARLERLLAAEWSDRGVTLHMSTPAEGLAIAADESLLDQAIINVVRNAADAASAAGDPQVWLEARLSERGRPVIEIADNGAGFDAEVAEKIFLPFFTTKAEGSGIGLSLARQVMLLHRGAISARPREGGGALFQLSF
jgi:nitrogen fixation/metabolism regulation signal transduction histidine kinase